MTAIGPPSISVRTAARLARLRQAATAVADPSMLVRIEGTVSETRPTSLTIRGLSNVARLTDLVSIETAHGEQIAEVVRIASDSATVIPFQRDVKASLGARAWLRGPVKLNPHDQWRGRTIDALGNPLDGKGTLPRGNKTKDVDGAPPAAMLRRRIEQPFATGITVIDAFTPLCVGQRIGIFAGSGVGKSTLLAMLSKASTASIVVVALVGERGREVREFLDEVLGNKRDNVIAVVATSDESTMMRRLAPLTAMAIAEHFRDSGESVLLLLDSVTRFAHAHREYALAAGELPVARGYPASMVTQLAHLLERAGPGEATSGFITAIVTVLVDGDDHNDPVADAARGLLDGHIVLNRSIAEQGRFPPVDVLASISRLSDKATTPAQKTLVAQLRQLISRFEETRDLRMISGHRPGADPVLDRAILLVPKIYEALKQDLRAPVPTNPLGNLAMLLQDPSAAKAQQGG